MADIKIYGADWCGMTRRTRGYLDELGVDYDYINVENDSAASDWVKNQNGGREKKPTLDIAGTVVTYPDKAEIVEILRSKNLYSV